MDLCIPNLGEGAESGSVVSLFVKEGDKVTKDQTLLELENEKAVAPIPSTHSGTVKKVYVKVGDKVLVGQAILALDESGAGQAPQSSPQEAVVVHTPPNTTPGVVFGSVPVLAKTIPGIPLPASPTIRKIAGELGIDLSQVRGSEAGGRIVMADIRAYIASIKNAAASKAHALASAAPKIVSERIDFSKWGPVKKTALSSLRRKIGQKMTESWTTIPHVTQFDEADITDLMALRKKFASAYEKKGARLTLTHFVMKAVVAALKKYPQFNSSLDEESQELVTKVYFHIGVAVDTESGLIVPVVRDADQKSLLDLAKELDALAEKTRQRKVSLDELKGGTFTISNLGGIGGTFFTPIVNKPEVAILGVGRGVLKPVMIKSKTSATKRGGSLPDPRLPDGQGQAGASGGKAESRLMLPLGLSYDHRVIDGADGARFIREIVQALENFNPKDLRI